MTQQLSCHDMPKMVAWLYHYFSSESNMNLYKISAISSKIICEIYHKIHNPRMFIQYIPLYMHMVSLCFLWLYQFFVDSYDQDVWKSRAPSMPCWSRNFEMKEWMKKTFWASNFALKLKKIFRRPAYDLFTHIRQGYFSGTGAIIWLPQCQGCNLEGYG